MKRIWLSITLLFVLIFVGACSASNQGTTQKGQTDHLSIITPHQKMIQEEWVPRFQAYYKKTTGRDVEVEWIDQGGTSDNLRFVESEFKNSPNGIKLDIFWGGGPTPYLKMADEGILQAFQVSKPILNKIPKSISGIPVYDAQYRWYGSAMSSFGIVYNKEVFKREHVPQPNSWEDLGKPVYYDKVSAADPRHSGSAHMIYSIILQAYSWEKAWDVLTRMAANVRTFIRSSSKVIKAVTTGEVAAGLAIDFYAWDLIAKYGSEKFGFVLPEGLTLVNPDPIAILKGAPHLEVAKKFVTFVLREENQKLWMLPAGAKGGPVTHTLGRIPIIPTLFDTIGKQSVVSANPFTKNSNFSYDGKKGQKLWTVINDMIGSTLIDTNEELRKSWKKIIDNGLSPRALKELVRIPVNEKTALELTDKWHDQVFRNQKIAEWQSFARKKYHKAATL